MKKITCVIGCSASGKDSLLREVVNKDKSIKEVISHTTRPVRPGEQQGKEYHFITQEDFIEMIDNDEFIETRRYITGQGTWFYGISEKAIDFDKATSYIVIVDFEGFKAIQRYYKNTDVDVRSVFIDAPSGVRITRSINRLHGDVDITDLKEIVRRFDADEREIEAAKEHCFAILTNAKSTDFMINVSLISLIAKWDDKLPEKCVKMF